MFLLVLGKVIMLIAHWRCIRRWHRVVWTSHFNCAFIERGSAGRGRGWWALKSHVLWLRVNNVPGCSYHQSSVFNTYCLSVETGLAPFDLPAGHLTLPLKNSELRVKLSWRSKYYPTNSTVNHPRVMINIWWYLLMISQHSWWIPVRLTRRYAGVWATLNVWVHVHTAGSCSKKI